MRKTTAVLFILFFLLPAGDLLARQREWWQLGYRPSAPLLTGYSASSPNEKPIRYSIRLTVYLEVRRNPRGEKVQVWLPLPADDHYQTVYLYRLKPAPDRIIESRYGYRIAYYDFGYQPPRAVMALEYAAEATVGLVRWKIDPERVGPLVLTPPQIRRDYLIDGPMYQIHHPAIAQAAREAVGDAVNPFWMAARIMHYVRSRLHYKLDARKWDAPTVLRMGEGSCSEYSYLMIAMARHLGLPARYIAGSRVKKVNNVSREFDDSTFHKVVEFYLPNVGWVPAESTGGLRHRKRTGGDLIGFVRRRMLFFMRETEPGLAPQNPRRNILTHVPFDTGSRLKISRRATLRWIRLD